MSKIVINTSLGGFTLSREAFLIMRERCNEHALAEPDFGEFWDDGSVRDEEADGFLCGVPRNDPDLVRVVEELGEKSWGPVSELKIIDVPENVEWTIDDDNGKERIHEKHRVWA